MAASRPTAWLVLEDGTVFRGLSVGAKTDAAFGEVVFNTALTGYQEVLTDPSYRGQIVVMTAPEIGNVGWNSQDDEASRAWLSGFVVRDAELMTSSWRAESTLEAFLIKQGVPAIADVDTRALTRRLRTVGAMRGVIAVVEDPAGLVERVKKSPGLEGRDLVKEVTCAKPYTWETPSWVPPELAATTKVPPVRWHVVAYDFGMKRNILCGLRDVGCKVTVVPATTTAKDAIALGADGYFLSNGPADPAAVTYGIEATKGLLATGKPLFGICLGHQILGLALGGKTYKLRYGHHGANHPVKDLTTGKVEITSQNHGFCVDVDSLVGKATLTHVNLNDQTVEGMALDGRPVFSVQYHPEASPGPHDAAYLFQRFASLLAGAK